MALRDKVAHSRKAVEAGIGSVLMLLASLLALGDVLPASVAVVVTAAVGVLTTVRVWLVANADLIDDAAEAVDGLQHDIRGKHRA